jgi:hypothetical protein
MPERLYEILENFINNENEKLILRVEKTKSGKDAILCFVSKDIYCPDDEQRGFVFLLYDDDSIHPR